MRVSVFGLGYVGSVTSACLAKLGHEVIGVDVKTSKCEMINAGKSPIVEARMEELVSEAHHSGLLRATSSVENALRGSDVSFISVATPSLRTGKLDTESIRHVCAEIGEVLCRKDDFHTIVIRSTVLPGTCSSLVISTLEKASGKRAGIDFGVCMNPEFLREGSAVADFFDPPFTVVGANDAAHIAPLRELYSFTEARFFESSLQVAEMVKYVCNAYHALKVAFANEVGTICRQLDVDPFRVTDIFTADTKLNVSAAYLRPGFAFGGSCLPKDVRALNYCAKELDVHLPLLQALLPSNNEHVERAAQAVLQTGKRKVGVLGLSFKPGTDDLRESPSVQLVKRLMGEGCEIQIWDGEVSLGRLIGSNRQFIEEVIPHIGSLLCDTVEQVVQTADVILVGTKAVDRQKLTQSLRPEQIVLDLVTMDYRASAASAIV